MALRIDKNISSQTSPMSDPESRGKVEKAARSFASDLSREADTQTKERLSQLLDKITSQGKKLSQTPTYAELKAYKELVKRFMSEAVGSMYNVETETGWDHRGRQKSHTLVKNINKAMEDLTEEVRQGEKQGLAILEKLDAIRGMLIDLYT